MSYETKPSEMFSGANYTHEVHNWHPPCSCGVGLYEALQLSAREEAKAGVVHNWHPPCSCGVSLDEVLE